MRVNVDSIALKDPRFRRLAKVLGCSWYEALGRCVAVWAAATDKRTDSLGAEEIDVAADLDGFAEAMGHAGLVKPAVVAGGVDLLRISGLADRIQYLKDQSSKGRLGGQTSASSRNRGLGVRDYDRQPYGQPNAPPYGQPKAESTAKANGQPNAQAFAQASDLDLDPDLRSLRERGDLETSARGVAPHTLSVFSEGFPDPESPGYRGLVATVRARGVDVENELEKFRRHVKAKAMTSADWQADWEKFLLQARPSKPLPPSPAPTQARDKFPPVSAREVSAEERAELSRMAAEAISVVDGKNRTEPEPPNYEVYDGEDGYDE